MHKRFGKPRGAFIIIPGFSHQSSIIRIKLIRGGGEFVEQPAHFLGSEKAMFKRGKGGQLPATRRSRFRRHIHFLIPVQQGQRGTDVENLAETFAEVLKFSVH